MIDFLRDNEQNGSNISMLEGKYIFENIKHILWVV